MIPVWWLCACRKVALQNRLLKNWQNRYLLWIFPTSSPLHFRNWLFIKMCTYSTTVTDCANWQAVSGRLYWCAARSVHRIRHAIESERHHPRWQNAKCPLAPLILWFVRKHILVSINGCPRVCLCLYVCVCVVVVFCPIDRLVKSTTCYIFPLCHSPYFLVLGCPLELSKARTYVCGISDFWYSCREHFAYRRAVDLRASWSWRFWSWGLGGGGQFDRGSICLVVSKKHYQTEARLWMTTAVVLKLYTKRNRVKVYYEMALVMTAWLCVHFVVLSDIVRRLWCCLGWSCCEVVVRW